LSQRLVHELHQFGIEMNQPQAARESIEGEAAANVNPRQGAEREYALDQGEDEDMDEGERGGEYQYGDETAISRRAAEIVGRIRRRIRDQPLTATGGAFILGFAFGNGVPRVVGRVGVAVALRALMQRWLERDDLLASVVDDG
jgi:hypothetical protein